MNKRSAPNEPATINLLQISTQELKSIKVAIKRKDVPPDAISGPLVRSLDDPESLIVFKPGAGEKPIFDRNDVKVNLDFGERIVIATSGSPIRRSKYAESEMSTGDRRSINNSRKKSPDRRYYEDISQSGIRKVSRSKPSFERDNTKYGNKREKSDNYASTGPSTSQKDYRRSPKERKSSSRGRESSTRYQKCRSPTRSDRRARCTSLLSTSSHRYRKYSRSPAYKPETTYRDHSHYRKSQDRRSRSPCRDRHSKYREYRKHSRSPVSRERYNSSGCELHREFSRSPPKYSDLPRSQSGHNPLPYHMLPHYGAPWSVYNPMSPYVQYIIPEGYVPILHKFPENPAMRPRMLQHPKPVSQDAINNVNMTTDACDSVQAVTTTQEIINTND